MPPPEVENSRDSDTMAVKSATDASATTAWPSRLPSSPPSLSTATTSPSEVADRVTATSAGLRTQPAACIARPAPEPSVTA